MMSRLREGPDAKGTALIDDQLKSCSVPTCFSDTHARKLQRRVQHWRGIMATKLAYATAVSPSQNSLQYRN